MEEFKRLVDEEYRFEKSSRKKKVALVLDCQELMQGTQIDLSAVKKFLFN